MTAISAKQEEVIRYWNRERPLILINEGAVRSGKTVANNLIWMRHVFAFAGRSVDFIVTGHTVPAVVRNVLQPLSDMFGVDTRLNSYNQFGLFGNRVTCFGGDNKDAYKAMTGMTAYGWYGNEISLQHENTIQEAMQRTSGDGFAILWDTNPAYPDHPVKREYIDRTGERLADGRERIHAVHWSLDDNPFLAPAYVENLKRSTPAGMWYDRSIKGLWVAAEGMIYEAFLRETHVCEPFDIPAEWERVGAIDLGFDNPFVHLWGALDPDRRLYIYREHYEAGRLLSYHAEAIKDGGALSWRVRDHDAQEGAELEERGIETIPAQKDVLLGIQKVAQRMAIQPDGKPRIMVFNNCVNLIDELGRYRWRGGGKKDEPVKEHDHACDALRYMVVEIEYPQAPFVSYVEM